MGHRRYASRTAADVDILDVLERALGPAAARAFDALLQQQHRGERGFRRHVSVEADLGADALEQITAARLARASHGTGGGRKRPTHRPHE